jgi:hypothetical protein
VGRHTNPVSSLGKYELCVSNDTKKRGRLYLFLLHDKNNLAPSGVVNPPLPPPMFGTSSLSRFIMAKFYHYTGLGRKLTTDLLVLQY